MKINSLNLAEGNEIPVEGSFLPLDGVVSFELYSTDIDTTKTIELQGSLSGERWDTLVEGGEDITFDLVASTPLVRSYNIDKRMNVRLHVPTGTGNISYHIAEG